MKKEKEIATVNRKYKDTIFRMVFKDKKELLSLYNAVNHSCYEKEEDLQIVTLENAVYMNVKNDLAFLIDFHLYLYEHQSTYNPNMPLRDLFYVASEYQKLIDERSLYSSVIVKVPAPKFIVFYNGRKFLPETVHLKLSDAYHTKEKEPDLELKVTMLNLNVGNHQELLNGCRTLKEYMLYVERVREYASHSDMTLDEAVKRAVDNVKNKFFTCEFAPAAQISQVEKRAEAVKMSIFEYDEEREMALMREAEYNAGMEEGMQKGIKEGMNKGIIESREEVASRMLSAGNYTLTEIVNISGLSQKKVMEIKDSFILSGVLSEKGSM